MTKYEMILEEIRNKIKNGTYAANEQIPTEAEICEAYNVSRITVKKAIDQLVYDGMVVKRRGAGTFVKEVSGNNGTPDTQLNGLFSHLDKSKVKSEVIEFEVVAAGSLVAEKLNIGQDDFVYHIIRFRNNSSNWKVIDHCYMPIDLIPGLKKEILYKSIYQYIEETLGLKIQSAHRTIQAIRPDQYDKKYMNLKDTDPVLSIEQVGYLDNGIAFEFSNQHHIGDDYKYVTVSVR